MIYKNVGYEQITIDDTVGGKSLTAGKYLSGTKYIADFVCIQVQTAQIRVTEDGTPPVAATTGLLFNPGDIFEVWGSDALATLRLIRETGTSAVVAVNYYGRGA